MRRGLLNALPIFWFYEVKSRLGAQTPAQRRASLRQALPALLLTVPELRELKELDAGHQHPAQVASQPGHSGAANHDRSNFSSANPHVSPQEALHKTTNKKGEFTPVRAAAERR